MMFGYSECRGRNFVQAIKVGYAELRLRDVPHGLQSYIFDFYS